MFAKLTGCLLLLLAFGAVQANADSVYQITGTLTIPGNTPGIVETINYSFQLTYTQAEFNNPEMPPIEDPSVTSSGPLGTFSLLNNSSQNYVGFFSPAAEIDLAGWFAPIFDPVPVPFQGYGAAEMYSCLTVAACAEFNNGEIRSGPAPQYAIWVDGTNSASVRTVSTPEPGTLCLFVLGALALCLMKKTPTP